MSDNRRRLLITSQIMGGGSDLTFPIYLIGGDNGELGIDVYNYLINKYINSNTSTSGVYNISEEIYCPYKVLSVSISWGNIVLGSNEGYTMPSVDRELSSSGYVIIPNHSGGGN